MIFSAAYNTASGDPAYEAAADLNGDGLVNFLDLTILSSVYGTPCSYTQNPLHKPEKELRTSVRVALHLPVMPCLLYNRIGRHSYLSES